MHCHYLVLLRLYVQVGFFASYLVHEVCQVCGVHREVQAAGGQALIAFSLLLPILLLLLMSLLLPVLCYSSFDARAILCSVIWEVAATLFLRANLVVRPVWWD